MDDLTALLATSWNGWGLSSGTCTLHTWNDSAAEDEGDTPVGKSYDSKLQYVQQFNDYKERRGPGSTLTSQPVRAQSPDEDSFIW